MRLRTIAIPCALLLSGFAALAMQGAGETATAAVQPGQWEIITEMTSVEAPGAPDELLQQMRSQMASQRQVRSQCITPEQARNPARNIVAQTPAHCEFSETSWAGAIIRIRAACQPPGNMSVRMSIDGGYTAQQFDGRIALAVNIPTPTEAEPLPMEVRIGGRITGRRTGECAAPDPRANENSLAPVN